MIEIIPQAAATRCQLKHGLGRQPRGRVLSIPTGQQLQQHPPRKPAAPGRSWVRLLYVLIPAWNKCCDSTSLGHCDVYSRNASAAFLLQTCKGRHEWPWEEGKGKDQWPCKRAPGNLKQLCIGVCRDTSLAVTLKFHKLLLFIDCLWNMFGPVVGDCSVAWWEARSFIYPIKSMGRQSLQQS